MARPQAPDPNGLGVGRGVNKPIRTISIFCMLLFLALMANATYLQYWEADALNKDSRNRRIIQEAFSRERGAILVAGDPVALSEKTDDEYEFQRTYPLPLRYAPVTGWFSYYSQTGVEQSQNDVLSGDDSRLFVTRLVDLVNGNNTEGGRVSLTIDPDAQTAAFDGLRALGEGVQGAVVAIEPSTGKILADVSLPTYDPNLLASHDFASVSENYDRLNEDPTKPLLNRGIQTTLPPGSTAATGTPRPLSRRGRRTSCRRPVATRDWSTTKAGPSATRSGSASRRRWSGRATPPSPSSPSRWAPRR